MNNPDPVPTPTLARMISVVIPAYNEAQVIGQTLTSLTEQTFTGSFEVIVVDNNSTDNTAQVAKQFVDKLNLKVITEKKQGRGAARAAGFAAAKGDIICSTDADTLLPPNWLTEITAPLSKSGVIASAGTCKINEATPLQNMVFNWLQPHLARLFLWRHKHPCFTGSNAAVFKSAYVKSGGFDPSINAFEDAEIAERLSSHGQIVLLTHLPVISSARRFRKGLIPGLLHYAKPYITMYVFDRRPANLSDIR
jgi:glycosyltransferase involved in cell wall biosynthesis